jgi:Polysaccharide lyase
LNHHIPKYGNLKNGLPKHNNSSRAMTGLAMIALGLAACATNPLAVDDSPKVDLVGLSDNASVSGKVSSGVSVNIEGKIVKSVFFEIKNATGKTIRSNTDTSSPYCLGGGGSTCNVFDTTKLSDGVYKLAVTAKDAAGQAVLRLSVNFNVLNSKPNPTPTPNPNPTPLPNPGTGKVLFSESFANGQFPNSIYKEQPYEGAFTVVPAPGGRGGYATKCSAFRSDDFSRTPGGGVPRCEGIPRGSTGKPIGLTFGKTYTIRTSYFLPANYQIDMKQPELSFQIHQNGPGRPPIQQDFQRGKVHWEVKWSQVAGYTGDPYTPPLPGATVAYDVANLADIAGKWVDLEVVYKPSAFEDGVFVVKMNGATVIDRKGPNNYNYTNGSNAGYIKMFGWYKWFWKSKDSDATERTIYYGPTQIIEN